MKTKFKVGDIVKIHKRIGTVIEICEQDYYTVWVDFGNYSTEGFLSNGKMYLTSKYRLRKLNLFTPKQMLDFTTYCISEGFSTPPTVRDLVKWINKQK